MHPIPLVHGLTVGELAQMINGEKWIRGNKKHCKLTVVNVQNWKHGEPYQLTVKPSPNLPNMQAIKLYPSLCLFEGTALSVGRGTNFPFQIIGLPDQRLGNFTFMPKTLSGAATPPHANTRCYGIDLRTTPQLNQLNINYLLDGYSKLGQDENKFFTNKKWFDLIAGSSELRTQIVNNESEVSIRDSWKQDLDSYKKIRKKYLLYPDY
jgi:uncharacterized protein YbbC (DUF1343 family)